MFEKISITWSSIATWRLWNILEQIRVGMKICRVSRFRSSLFQRHNNEEESAEDLCINDNQWWNTSESESFPSSMDESNLLTISSDAASSLFKYLPLKFFTGIEKKKKKEALGTFSRHSSCFEWNVKMGHNSRERVYVSKQSYVAKCQ